MTFEEVKEMFKKSIDTTDNMNQAIENLIQSVYLKGYNDALNNAPANIEADFPQTKDVEPTVENFSKVLDNKLINNAIRDYETDTKGKSCNTCKNNDDELSGECYECIKGIFDHYEPQESEEK